MALLPPRPQVPHQPQAAGGQNSGQLNVQPPIQTTQSALSAQDLSRAKALSDRLRARFATSLVGQESLREALITTMTAGGHLLIESVPGLAKTTAAQILASSVSGSFKRVQCTPDLMPSDLVGTQIFDFANQRFHPELGPIHANFVLLDEINRSNAKTQSAMLEAMAEGATTIGGKRIPLPKPFMVIATQNPIEEEGTYTLPEAQMDRFMIKAVMTYPSADEEQRMLGMLTQRGSDSLEPSQMGQEALSNQDVLFLRDAAKRVHVSDSIMGYAVDLAATSRGMGTRPIPGLASLVRLGASPRASIALVRMGQAKALLSGRDYVIPEDLKACAHDVLRHRIMLTFEAQADGTSTDDIINTIVETVPVP